MFFVAVVCVCILLLMLVRGKWLIVLFVLLFFQHPISMADQHSGEGSSTSNMESSDATVQIKIKTLDSQIYNFEVDKNVSTGFYM